MSRSNVYCTKVAILTLHSNQMFLLTKARSSLLLILGISSRWSTLPRMNPSTLSAPYTVLAAAVTVIAVPSYPSAQPQRHVMYRKRCLLVSFVPTPLRWLVFDQTTTSLLK